MVRIFDRAPEYLSDMRKRAAREFSSGNMSKDEFDKYCKHVEELEKLTAAVLTRSKKEGKRVEGTKTN